MGETPAAVTGAELLEDAATPAPDGISSASWAGTGQIIGGREARPHSRPYMAFILIRTPGGLKACGGFLVRDDFVMAAAHCLGSQMNVILGAHNVRTLEGMQQRVPVLRPIPHPGYSPWSHSNDIMLLQLVNRVQRNRFVKLVPLPQTQNRLRPGTRCTVAGWGLTGPNMRTDTLQCVQLSVQRDRVCRRRFMSYNGRTQICVGDPRQKSAFVVERILDGGRGRQEQWKSPHTVLPKLSDIYFEPQSTTQVKTQSSGNSQCRPISPPKDIPAIEPLQGS
ncbi:cathepsin G-like isoform X1 [Cervus canadensis]|uniref:cathepsin G-like isoform X1 n=1 Tax=Cervus canadensis TaxID=1574408 RepID=UPI001C9E283D|nr:cathepsin G-like isoform X1 [Cervus canadensis]